MVEYDWGVEDIPMDFDSLAMAGSMGGSGGVIVMDDSVDMVEALGNITAFYAHESCGQCTPCREGSLWMKKITARMVHGEARAGGRRAAEDVADKIAGPDDLRLRRGLRLAGAELRRQVRRRVHRPTPQAKDGAQARRRRPSSSEAGPRPQLHPPHR